MKSIHGLALAAALGVAGAILNFAYLHNKSQNKTPVEFLGIKAGTTINAGEPFSDDDLEVVSIPDSWVGNLRKYAVLAEARKAAVGEPSWRRLSGPRLLLEEDIRTPPPDPRLRLAEGEASIGVPVDSRAYPLALVMPGDRVSFLVSRLRINSPTPAVADDPDNIEDPLDPVAVNEAALRGASGPTETIGPFEVLSLGNRLVSSDVMKANRIPQLQGNVMTIRVKVDKNNELTEEKAKKLVEVLLETKFREVGILHFPQDRELRNR